MLYIDGLKDNIIQLDKTTDSDYVFKIVSENENGKRVHCMLDYVSDFHIKARIVYGDTIKIHVKPSFILEEQKIVLVNTIGDITNIRFIPNEYYVMDKTYTFKITSKKLLDDGSLRIKIFSKVNDMELGWKCTYDGKPMEYSISTRESDKGENVTIKPISTILSEFTTVIEFAQDESNNVIRLVLTNTPEVGISNFTLE